MLSARMGKGLGLARVAASRGRAWLAGTRPAAASRVITPGRRALPLSILSCTVTSSAAAESVRTLSHTLNMPNDSSDLLLAVVRTTLFSGASATLTSTLRTAARPPSSSSSSSYPTSTSSYRAQPATSPSRVPARSSSIPSMPNSSRRSARRRTKAWRVRHRYLAAALALNRRRRRRGL